MVLQNIKTGYGACVAAVSRFTQHFANHNKAVDTNGDVKLREIQQCLYEVIHHSIPKYMAQLEKDIEEINSLIDTSIEYSLRNVTELGMNCECEKQKLLHILNQVKQLNIEMLGRDKNYERTKQFDTNFDKIYLMLEVRIGIIEEFTLIAERLGSLADILNALRKEQDNTNSAFADADSTKMAINQSLLKITEPIKTITSPIQIDNLALTEANNSTWRGDRLATLSSNIDLISAKILQTRLIVERDKDVVFKISELVRLLKSQVTEQFSNLREINRRANNLSVRYAQKSTIDNKEAKTTLAEIHQFNKLISSLSLKLPG